MRRSSRPGRKILSKSTNRTTARVWVLLLAGVAGWHALPASVPATCEGPVSVAEGAVPVIHCTGRSEAGAVRGAARRLFGLPIDANRAAPPALETLPGIGPARARAWMDARLEAPFRSWRDLERIRGIGPKRAAALRDVVCFERCPPCPGASC